MKTNRFFSALIGILFLSSLFFFAIGNYSVIIDPVSQYSEHKTTIVNLKNVISERFKSDDLFHKDEFVNLNGIYGKITKRRYYNQVILLKNGMLSSYGPAITKQDEKIQSMVEFSKFVEERGGHFIYAQLPHKIDYNMDLMPDGLDRNFITSLERYLQKCKDAGVDVLDTLPEIIGTEEDFNNYYYKTDIHWKPVAAFRVFQMLVDHIREFYPEQSFPDDFLSLDSWTIHEIPDQFLGTWGKRVGLYFIGLDSLQYITPNFETDISLSVPKKQRFIKGNYEEAFLLKQYMEPGGNKLHTGHYDIYIGGGYPITQTFNPAAPSDLRILVFKDSYVLPLQTFLSVMFRYVDVIDPRYYTETSLNEYVDRTSPDVVISAFNAKAISIDNYYEFSNTDDILISEDELIIKNSPLQIENADNQSNYAVYYSGFENEKVYTLYIPKIEITSGTPEAVTLCLYDRNTKKAVLTTSLDVETCNLFGNCKWTFETPESLSKNLELRIYSGFLNRTKNNGIAIEDISLVSNTIINE